MKEILNKPIGEMKLLDLVYVWVLWNVLWALIGAIGKALIN